MTVLHSSCEADAGVARLRAADAARAVLGAGLLLRPELPAQLIGIDRTEGVVAATRLLGGRWLLQAVIGAIAARRGRTARVRAGRVDVAVETTHALSMLALGSVAPRLARPAATSGALAVAFAVADARAAARLRDAARS